MVKDSLSSAIKVLGYLHQPINLRKNANVFLWVSVVYHRHCTACGYRLFNPIQLNSIRNMVDCFLLHKQTFIISIIDICVYPRYIYRYHTSMAMGKGLGRLVQYHLCTGRPLVKWLEISSRGFHPEQPTGHTATVSPRRKFFPNSKLTQVKLN